MENETQTGIYRKIVAVYEDVKYIQKDKRNDFHKYTYASEAAIKAALHDAFTRHGLAMLPPDIESIHDGEKDAKGQFLTTVKIRFGIADKDSGESVSGTIYGRGVDNSDKGIYKAITGGLKYFLTTTFLIPTGDDPEEEEEKPVAKSQPKQQAAKPTPADAAETRAWVPIIASYEKKLGAEAYKLVLKSFNYSSADKIELRDEGVKVHNALKAAMAGVAEPAHV